MIVSGEACDDVASSATVQLDNSGAIFALFRIGAASLTRRLIGPLKEFMLEPMQQLANQFVIAR
jgi:hypothetical protein